MKKMKYKLEPAAKVLEPKNKQIHVKLSAKEDKKFKKAARARKMSVGHLVRSSTHAVIDQK